MWVEIARVARHVRWRATQAPSASNDQLLLSGLYDGLLDQAGALHLGSWGLARKLSRVPDPAPRERIDIHAYLAGYLQGSALVALADAARRRRQLPWSRTRAAIIAHYATALASPDVQRDLAIPGEKPILLAHHFACIVSAKHGPPLDWQTELDLFRWLAARSDLTITPALEQRLLRGRQRRPQDGGHLPPELDTMRAT